MSTDGSRRTQARLPDLSPVGVCVQAVVPDSDLAFIGDVGGHPGDELQIVHHLRPLPLAADNEGHVIRYQVSISPDGRKIVFVSPVSPSSPRYRMTTILLPDDRVRITFEVAPPGKPEEFTKYTDGLARRKK